jgi:hypothetical protein
LVSVWLLDAQDPVDALGLYSYLEAALAGGLAGVALAAVMKELYGMRSGIPDRMPDATKPTPDAALKDVGKEEMPEKPGDGD